jgi:hypothetical protein
MSTVELRKRLIDKIKITEDERILEEAYRLLELEMDDIEIYKLNADQKEVIREARQQIKDGQFLTEEQANNEIDEWLKK